MQDMIRESVLAAVASAGTGRSVAASLAILALAATVGLSIGGIRFRSLKLGISGVLFAALLFGQAGFTIETNVLQFLRNFALIVFMYAIGLQVGPGFGASLRAEGLRLNVLALCVIGLGALLTAGFARFLPQATASGLYAGAFTTTPGLAAAQETLHDHGDAADRAAIAYSVAYPFGIVGPMLVITLLRRVFRVHLEDEKAALAAADKKHRPRIETMDVEVTLPEQTGTRLADHPLLRDSQIVLSRLLRDDVMTVPTADTVVQVGDVYRALGPPERLAAFVSAIGRRSALDESKLHGDIGRMDIVVTRAHVRHRSLRDLDLIRRFGVTISRVNRAGVELPAKGTLRLAFADQVTAVGPKAGLERVEAELGNCLEKLNQSPLIPIFLGIVLGVVVGSVPIVLPGLHGSVHLGLAGGTLLAAIALSRLGSFGPVVWYMPAAANALFRDFGLAIFLACVGFEAGDHFVQRAAQTAGLTLVLVGAAITVLPVLTVACFARAVLRTNFVTLSGWAAGAMGSSTTLFFAEDMTESDAPAVAYAAVLPLAELMPIICAQVLAILSVRH